jgi:hypothetical protein
MQYMYGHILYSVYSVEIKPGLRDLSSSAKLLNLRELVYATSLEYSSIRIIWEIGKYYLKGVRRPLAN